MPIIFANVIQDAFGPLITVFEGVMVFIHDNILHGSWGFSIIGLTIVVRALLVPLTLKQSRSMLKLQALAPDMQALRERYKDDKQRLNQEMMKLYQERGVNPFASCLPLLLQLPVFFSLFYMLRLDLKKHICLAQMHAHGYFTDSQIQAHSCNSVAPHSAKFLFVPDLTNKATGVVLVVLIVLYIGSQLVSSLLMTVTSDRNQRLLALGLPFVFTIFVATFPAGLLVYWITTNVWTIGQQWLVKKRVGTPPPLATAKPAPAGARALSSPSNGDKGGGDRKAAAPEPDGDRAARAAAPARGAARARATPPPRPPRKKKKRSGRRR
jgi:YidC/Oxa1 family membrane protein insertase